MPPRNSHCSYCGHAFVAEQVWPRRCAECDQVSYLNPLPVAVAVLPVDGGLLVVRRDVEPKRDELALPGGFIDVGESWQAAAVRELREETGIVADASSVELFDVLSAPDGTLLVFGLLPPATEASLPPSAPTEEATGWQILRQPTRLAFPLHTQAADAFFHRAAAVSGRPVAGSR